MKYLKYFVIVPVVLAVLLIITLYQSRFDYKDNTESVEEYKEVIEKINEAVSKSSEPIFIFDRNDKFISSFGNTVSIKDAPKYLLDKMQENIVEVYKYTSSIFLKQLYNPDVDDINSCALYLQNSMADDNIIEFVLSCGMFGNDCVGIGNASYYYFNTPIQNATDRQIDYLLDMLFSGANVNYDNYIDITFANKPNSFNYGIDIIKSLVSAEMVRHTSGFNLSGCNIKLGINKELQEEISRSLLHNFKSYIEQDSEGSPYLNGSVIVLDKTIGLISCYVPSANSSSNIFQMNVKDLTENLKQLYEEISGDSPLWFCLNSFKESDGTITYDTLRHFFDKQMLYNSNDLSEANVLDICSMLFSSNIEYREPELILEIRKDNNLVYNSKQNLLNNFNVAEAHICEFFRQSTFNNTQYGYDLNLPTGIVSFRVTGNYAVVMLLGTNSINGNLSEVEVSNLVQARESIYNIINKYYNDSDENIWFIEDLDVLKQNIYDHNENILSTTFNRYLDTLGSLSITSKEEKKMFEDLYERGLNFIEYYKDSLGEVHYKESLDRLSDIRIKRNAELLKYSV